MTAYYNEIDPFAAAWLRELIKSGHIAPGEVDERSIEDVTPNDLAGFVQCHFFAGIGVWSYALRRAGWPDERPVWTGSCPCQPFSAAGKGNGFTDERHLWPALYHLIGQCRPDHVFGEQVASQGGLAWINLVQADMENAAYTCGVVDTCAAGFGAPHIRQRLYWVAHTVRTGWPARGAEPGHGQAAGGGGSVWLGHSGAPGLPNCERAFMERPRGREEGGTVEQPGFPFSGMEKPEHDRCEIGDAKGQGAGAALPSGQDCAHWPGPVNGNWRDVDWLFCRDGKWRPTQSVSEQMADGLAHRLGYSRFSDLFSLNPLKKAEKEDMRSGRLRGYGNAICAPQAEEFIRAYMEVTK